MMTESESESRKEAAMVMAMNELAEKYGCKVKVDFETHTIDFDCPNKQAEVDLAFEIKNLFDQEAASPD